MNLRKKRQGVKQFKTCCFKLLLSFIISITVSGINNGTANAKAIKGTRIAIIKQNIEKKEQIIGCSRGKCTIHKNKKYGEKKCVSGSDLFNIQVKIKKKGKTQYKSLYDMKFESMQGGCIKGNHLFLAFSDKGKNSKKKKDLTAIIKIDLTESKVKKVTLVKGAAEKNIDGLGHANDLTYQNGKLHAAWYMTKGTGKKYSDKIGYINKEIEGKGIGVHIANKKETNKIAAFGITSYSKKHLALGIREIGNKTVRYISTYKPIKKEYKKKKKLFTLVKNKKFSAPQCMEYYKKFFYVVRFNKKGGKKNNNCLELYNKKGTRIKTYTIKDPKSKIEDKALNNSQKPQIVTENMIEHKWEIESFSHYKGNTFYYTQFKPTKRGKKQAYLYKINLKAKAKSTDKKTSKNKKKSKDKKKAKKKTKTKTKTTKKATTKKKPKTKAKKKTKK